MGNQSSSLANVDEDQVDGLPDSSSQKNQNQNQNQHAAIQTSNLSRFHSTDGSSPSSRTSRWNRAASRLSSSTTESSPSTPIASTSNSHNNSNNDGYPFNSSPSSSSSKSRPHMRSRSRSINTLFPKHQQKPRDQHNYPATTMEEAAQSVSDSKRRTSVGESQAGGRIRKKSIDLIDYVPSSEEPTSISRNAPGVIANFPRPLTNASTGANSLFEPHLVVSPFPSPSVASSNHHASGRNAAGLSTPQETASGVTSTSGSGSGSSTATFLPDEEQAARVAAAPSSSTTPSNIEAISVPQDVPAAIAFDNGFTRNSIFPTAGTSSSTLASLPAWQSPLFTTNHPHPHPNPAFQYGAFQSNPGSGFSSPFAVQSPPNNSQQQTKTDPLGRQLHSALPSYLKIPTTIPSTFASTPSAPPSPSPTPAHNRSSSSSPTSQQFFASRSSSVSEGGSGSSVDEDELEQQSVGTAESEDAVADKPQDDEVTPSVEPVSASPWEKNPDLAASSGGPVPARPVLAPSGAAAAVLSLDDVVIEPGHASKASSPEEGSGKTGGSGSGVEGKSRDDEMGAEGGLLGEAGQRIEEEKKEQSKIDSFSGKQDEAGIAAQSDPAASPEGLDQSTASSTTTVSSSAYSRTPTPTPETVPGARALTPTGTPASSSQPLKSLSSIASSGSGSGSVAPAEGGEGRRLDVITGGESGVNTPALPPGLTSAPPSASSPTVLSPHHHQGAGNFNALQHQYRMTQAHPTTHGETSSSGRKRRSEGGVSTGSVSTVNSTSTTPTATPTTSRGFTPTSTSAMQSPSAPLMPIVLTWRGGGREVFVTGTFANEWRSKILLKKNSSGVASGGGSFLPGQSGHKHSNSSGSNSGSSKRGEREHSCVLHLPPGTHRLKFIVDDRWRVSRHLATATDGDGNLVNYVEIPNVGPAHNGPLSAPGEDLLEGGSDGERRRARARARERAVRSDVDMERRTSKSSTGTISQTHGETNSLTQVVPGDNALANLTAKEDVLASPETKKSLEIKEVDEENEPKVEEQRTRVHKQTLDLVAEARKAEAQRRGELDDVFGEDEAARRARAEQWTKEIPASIIAAQEAEEAWRERQESNAQSSKSHSRSGSTTSGAGMEDSNLPIPPSLPRQLEKVILNSSPANPSMAPPGGTVDDNSILPAPNHVVLNHLTASAIKGGVLAVGTTTRYKRKYVTTVFYRPVQQS